MSANMEQCADDKDTFTDRVSTQPDNAHPCSRVAYGRDGMAVGLTLAGDNYNGHVTSVDHRVHAENGMVES